MSFRSFVVNLIGLLLLGACSSAGYNPTTHPYEINRDLLAEKPVRKVVLASANFSGEPTRQHLESGARRVKGKIKQYLREHDIELAPDHLFTNAWNQALRTYGNMYDPTTGRVDQQTWRAVMVSTAEALRAHEDIDAIVFADLIEHEVQHSGGMKHYARWYGVSRKPALQGPGSGVPADFNWGQPVKAASLVINIYSVELERLFSSRGGIDVLQAIDMKMSSPSFVRRRKLLDNESHVEEGIELAFHPFIPMQKYPGRPPEEEAADTAGAE